MTKDTAKVKGIYLYFDIYQSTKLMSNEQKAMFLDAILTKFNGSDFEITDPVVQMAFSFVERSFNYEREKNLQRSEKAKQSASMRWHKTQCDDMRMDANNANACERIKRNANDAINIKHEIKNINNSISDNKLSLVHTDAVDACQGSLLEDAEKPCRERSGIPDCPHEQIVALYHECLPELRKVKRWTGKRASHLKARWRENWKRYVLAGESAPSVAGGLDYWKRFFTWIHGQDFLMGKVNSFQADLEWIVNPNNFTNITESKYVNRV